MASDYIDSKAAAAALGVSLSRVQQLIRQKRLPAVLIGGSYAIRRADLAQVRDRKPGRPKAKPKK